MLTPRHDRPDHAGHPAGRAHPIAATATTPTAALRSWALWTADQQWPVFPLHPGSKRPAVREWETRATCDQARIARCWHDGGTPWNIGLATGPAGLVVLDLDQASGEDEHGPDGAASLAGLADARRVVLEPTFTVTTPRGGSHQYYRVPAGVLLRNTQGSIGARIDTRAAGGYVVAPGSILPAGGYGLADDTDPAVLPAWLVQVLTERRSPTISGRAEKSITTPSAWVSAALDRECHAVRTAPRGRHNSTLNAAAYALGQLVGAGALDYDHAHHELTSAAGFLVGADCDCTHTDTTRVITAALAAGAANPRRQLGATNTGRTEAA